MDKLKIDFLETLQKNNDFDNLDFELSAKYVRVYRETCDNIFTTKNIENIKYIMMTLQDWKLEAEMIDDICDRLLTFAINTDAKAFLTFFLKNMKVMHPHAKEGIRYIFLHFLQMDVFKPFVYENFLNLTLDQKLIFKEIYTLIVEEDREYFSIPEIDEALKSIA